MGDHAAQLPLGGRHHLGRRRAVLDESLEVRGGAAAEERAIAAGENGGYVGGLDAGRLVADAIHTRVQADQRSGPQPVPDLLRADTGAQQLRPGHHSVGSRRQPADHPLYRSI
jgi:hypothetical protein